MNSLLVLLSLWLRIGGSIDAGSPPVVDQELIDNLELLENLEEASDLELMRELGRAD